MRRHHLSGSAPNLRKSAIAVTLLNLCALFVIAAPAQSWQDKDWTQWTMFDCREILHNSPWSVQGGAATQNDMLMPQGRNISDLTPTAQMSSSLIIRQALVRQAQLSEHYDKMNPQKQKAFDQKSAACLGKTYDDRFIIHIFFAELLGPFRLSVDGQQIHSRELSKASISPCIDQAGTSIAFLRVIDGKSVVPPSAKELKVGDFTFNLEKMIYKGKLDF